MYVPVAVGNSQFRARWRWDVHRKHAGTQGKATGSYLHKQVDKQPPKGSPGKAPGDE